MRIWRDADSPYGLLYTCQQAQIQWKSDNPMGMLLLPISLISTGVTVVCHDHSCKHNSLLICCKTSHCGDGFCLWPYSMAIGIFTSVFVATLLHYCLCLSGICATHVGSSMFKLSMPCHAWLVPCSSPCCWTDTCHSFVTALFLSKHLSKVCTRILQTQSRQKMFDKQCKAKKPRLKKGPRCFIFQTSLCQN